MIEKKYNLLKNLFRFWNHVSNLKKRHFFYLFFLMLINTFLEMLSVGAIFPFISILTSPEIILKNQFFLFIFELFGISKDDNLILILGFSFIIIVLLTCFIRLTVLYFLTKFSFSLGEEIGYKMYNYSLLQSFKVHINRNSSDLINAIINQTNNVVFSVILSFLTLCNSLFVLIGVGIVLLIVNVNITLVAIVFFITLYLIILALTKKHLIRSGEIVTEKGAEVIKSLQEGLGGIRDIIVDGTYNAYLKIFNKADKVLKASQGNIQIISGSPKYIIEAIAMISVAILCLIASKSPNGIINFIPIIGTLALGAQRLLPALQEAFRSLSTIKGTESSLLDVLNYLDQKIPDYYFTKERKIAFNTSISFKNIEFSYQQSGDYIFKNLNYTFLKGKRIGIIGQTGVGKSTFIDIIMGLLEVDKGDIFIDKNKLDYTNLRSWQRQIAHVPQKIFLTDDSICKNIAFGVQDEDIDDLILKKAIKDAQLDEFINKLPNGYHTKVGEMGVKLSGGQKQRVGIARALYKNAKLIIFDEATNSLDNKTEALIMNTIYNLNKNITLIIIAHRLSTLSQCDEIIEIKNFKISKLQNFVKNS